MICPNCGTSSQGKFCPQCGTELRNQPSGAENKPTGVYFSENVKAAARSDVPMTWHKWLIYGLLWIWALSYLVTGTALLDAGASFWGILFLALAAGCVYVRFQLARLKTGAPKKLLILFIISDVLNFLILLAFAESSDGSGMPSIALNIIFTIANWRYYSSREHLFIN